MNVTEDGFKYRQLHMEDYLQMVPAEQGEQAGGYAHQRITENNRTSTDFHEPALLEMILQDGNLEKAYKKVKSNKGAGGIDRMEVAQLQAYLAENQKEIVNRIRAGKYRPVPVLRVEIAKENTEKKRKLGIPTVVDRVIQQAVTQILSPIYERQFSDNSYGFRPERSAHGALKQCQREIDEGYVYVVDMDLERFFDTVCQSKLIELLSRTIKDGRVISLIHKYLNAGVIANGMFEKTEEGLAQGGPLSPLLSNIMLNELDKELERRGHRFVRYADDCMIFCRSRKSAERTLNSITQYIEGKLYLKVNREKTTVSYYSQVKYLGYKFYRHKGKCRLRVHPKSMIKMKNRLRELTNKNNGWGNGYRPTKLAEYIRGWVNYFKLADMEAPLRKTDEWMRRRIRAVYWKQWKLVKTRYKKLRQYGLQEELVHQLANSRKGTWKMALMLNRVLTNNEITNLGYLTMSGYYKKICEN